MSEVRTIAVPDTKEIRSLAESTLQTAKDLVIKDEPSYEVAGDFLGALKSREKSIDGVLDPFVRNNYDAWQAALALKAQHMGPVKEAEVIVKAKIKTYRIEAERKYKEEELRLREEAREAEEAERLRRAEELLAAGRPEDAIVLLEGEHESPPIVVTSAIPKHRSIIDREVWKFRIKNEALIPREYLVPDEVKIGKVVRATEGKIEIPGIECYSDKEIAGRAK